MVLNELQRSELFLKATQSSKIAPRHFVFWIANGFSSWRVILSCTVVLKFFTLGLHWEWCHGQKQHQQAGKFNTHITQNNFIIRFKHLFKIKNPPNSSKLLLIYLKKIPQRLKYHLSKEPSHAVIDLCIKNSPNIAKTEILSTLTWEL